MTKQEAMGKGRNPFLQVKESNATFLTKTGIKSLVVIPFFRSRSPTNLDGKDIGEKLDIVVIPFFRSRSPTTH